MNPYDLTTAIPKGLPGTTADKIAQLAALITSGIDLPYAKPYTEKVLPSHMRAKWQMRNPNQVDIMDSDGSFQSDEAVRVARGLT